MEEKLFLLRLVLPLEAARTSELRDLPRTAGGAVPLPMLRASMGPAWLAHQAALEEVVFPPEPFKALHITPSVSLPTKPQC